MSTQNLVHIHQDLGWFDNGFILIQDVLCPHKDQSVVYVHIHQDFQCFGNGVIHLKEVLCPYRDKSVAYVHIHQDFQWFDNGVILVQDVLCPHTSGFSKVLFQNLQEIVLKKICYNIFLLLCCMYSPGYQSLFTLILPTGYVYSYPTYHLGININ